MSDDLRVTLFGLVHADDCPDKGPMTWPWEGRNNFTSDRAHEACLPDRLPAADHWKPSKAEADALLKIITDGGDA